MLFDIMCRFLETNQDCAQHADLKDLLFRYMRRAAIFSYRGADLAAEMKSVERDPDTTRSRSFLPFDVVWVENEKSGCLITAESSELVLEALGESPDPNKYNAIYTEGYGRLGDKKVDYYAPLVCIGLCRTDSPSLFCLVSGGVAGFTSRDGLPAWRSVIKEVGYVGIHGRAEFVDGNAMAQTDEGQALARKLGSGVMSIAMSSMLLINHPKKWIVRVESTMAHVVNYPGVVRSKNRPKHIVVSDDEISRVLREPNPENVGTVKPHRRRAHTHLLKSERFTWRRGERVFVKACWVGPETAEYGGERYTVCLDL